MNVPVRDIEKLRKNQGIPELTEGDSTGQPDESDDEQF